MAKHTHALAVSLAACLLLTTLTGCNTAATPGTTTPPPSATPAPVAAALTYADTIAWDGEYDVVVVGYGGAGASAAITASDGGANTLVLEKAPKGEAGGNTRICGQYIMDFERQEDCVTYLKSLRENFTSPSDEYLATMVAEMSKNEGWLTGLGAKSIFRGNSCEYPGFAGGETIQMLLVEGETLYDNFNSKLWRLLDQNVSDRDVKNVDVWYESPALHLIQDSVSKTIVGVQAQHDGKTVNIRANNGVILACGGFENNPKMVQDYLHREAVFPHGTTYNTGDGITMALEVNADLWHMGAMSGGFLTIKGFGEENPQVPFFNMGQNVTKGTSVINIANDGKRFVNEGDRSRHGFVNYHGEWKNQLQFSNMYTIFDETTRLAGPLYNTFSTDNSAEIENGLIIKADTIDELAGKIGMDPSTLSQTISTYNQYAKSGVDADFNRAAKTMTAFDGGPYYAVKLVSGMVNTQGGPRRNVSCEVLDTQGNVIPNLYSAGELGSMYANNYQGGGNIAEALATGRISGANAATIKAPLPEYRIEKAQSTLTYTVNSTDRAGESDVMLAEGEYLGTGTGMGGAFQVKVTMGGDKILAVEVLEHSETEGIGDKAIAQITDAILAAQSADVDSVSGATITSDAIREAVKDALVQAGK